MEQPKRQQALVSVQAERRFLMARVKIALLVPNVLARTQRPLLAMRNVIRMAPHVKRVKDLVKPQRQPVMEISICVLITVSEHTLAAISLFA